MKLERDTVRLLEPTHVMSSTPALVSGASRRAAVPECGTHAVVQLDNSIKRAVQFVSWTGLGWSVGHRRAITLISPINFNRSRDQEEEDRHVDGRPTALTHFLNIAL